jgi:oxygen-independent coproporphyrinogen-3 oxidase
MDRYYAALKKEIIYFCRVYKQRLAIDTIFLGGGTPSTWPTELLLDMSDTLKEMFTLSDTLEFTIEVNPGTVNNDKLQIWKKAGINRLSIGVQSLNDHVLKLLNRHQTVESVHQLLAAAKKLFNNLSIDLILGLPGITIEAWKETINTVVHWPLKHISVYFLTVHENTPLYFAVKRKEITLPFSDEITTALYEWTVKKLEENNFEQYEISNFANKGYSSRHNRSYWDHLPYKGFGLGACSFDGSSRLQNTKNLMNYIQGIEKGENINDFHESLTEEQYTVEKLMLQLRQAKGIQAQYLFSRLPSQKWDLLKSTLEDLKWRKLIKYEGDAVRLTVTGCAVEHEIVLKLLC